MTNTVLNPHYVSYTDQVEQIDSDERDTIDKIVDLMTREEGITREKYDRSVRVSHAKAHGLLVGTLEVSGDLPEPFQQGLFVYPVMADKRRAINSAPVTEPSRISEVPA